MSKRSSRAAEKRVRQQRALADGMTKPLLDEANRVSMELHGVGIGVLTAEQERCQVELARLEAELKQTPRRDVMGRQHLAAAIGRVRDDERRWTECLRQVADKIMDHADAEGAREVYERQGRE